MQCRGLDVYTPIDRVVNRWLGAFQLKRDSVKKRERKKLQSVEEQQRDSSKSDTECEPACVCVCACCGCVYISLFMNEAASTLVWFPKV